MKLSDANSDRFSIALICQHCNGRQPAYPNLMIEKHHADTDLEIALRLWPCMWCGETGDFTTVDFDRG